MDALSDPNSPETQAAAAFWLDAVHRGIAEDCEAARLLCGMLRLHRLRLSQPPSFCVSQKRMANQEAQ